MKKLSRLFLVLVMITVSSFAAIACGGSSEEENEDIVGKWQFYSLTANGGGQSFSFSINDTDELAENYDMFEIYIETRFEFFSDGTATLNYFDYIDECSYIMDGSTVNLVNEDDDDEGLLGFSYKISEEYLVCSRSSRGASITLKYAKVTAFSNIVDETGDKTGDETGGKIPFVEQILGKWQFYSLSVTNGGEGYSLSVNNSDELAELYDIFEDGIETRLEFFSDGTVTIFEGGVGINCTYIMVGEVVNLFYNGAIGYSFRFFEEYLVYDGWENASMRYVKVVEFSNFDGGNENRLMQQLIGRWEFYRIECSAGDEHYYFTIEECEAYLDEFSDVIGMKVEITADGRMEITRGNTSSCSFNFILLRDFVALLDDNGSLMCDKYDWVKVLEEGLCFFERNIQGDITLIILRKVEA